MEYVQGETVEKVILDRGHLPWREVVELGIQICEALHYAHEHGVVHRDLKPSNLMVTADGKIKLTDFGIAKDLDATALTATGRTLGTAAYMSPEQIRGTPAVSHKTDLYALGVVLYQMLVGKAAVRGNDAGGADALPLERAPSAAQRQAGGDPQEAGRLVVSLMAKSPADRPWDAAAVAAKLTELRDKADAGRRSRWSGRRAALPRPSPRRAGRRGSRQLRRRSPERTRKKKGKAGSTQSNRSRSDPERWFLVAQSRHDRNGTSGLALVAIGGVIAYMVWPPSAEYLFKHAEALMASSASRRQDDSPARITSSHSTSGFPTTRTANRPENGSTRSCSKTRKAGPRT